jgi:hypothetical protein
MSGSAEAGMHGAYPGGELRKIPKRQAQADYFKNQWMTILPGG